MKFHLHRPLSTDMLTAAQLCAAIVFAISAMTLYGYLTGQASLYTWRSVEDQSTATPMAIPTAISLVVLSFGIYSIARVVKHELQRSGS